MMKHTNSNTSLLLQSEMRFMKAIFTVGAAVYIILFVMSVGSLFAEGTDPDNQKDTALNIWYRYKANNRKPVTGDNDTLNSYSENLDGKAKKKNIEFDGINAFSLNDRGLMNIMLSETGDGAGFMTSKRGKDAKNPFKIVIRKEENAVLADGPNKKLKKVTIPVDVSNYTFAVSNGEKPVFRLSQIPKPGELVRIEVSNPSGNLSFLFETPPLKDDTSKLLAQFRKDNPVYSMPGGSITTELKNGKLEFTLNANTKKPQIEDNSTVFLWTGEEGDELVGFNNLNKIKIDQIKNAKQIQINGGLKSLESFLKIWNSRPKLFGSSEPNDLFKTLDSRTRCSEHI